MRELSEATGINLKNLNNIDKETFNKYATYLGINKNSVIDLYAVYQTIKYIENKKEILNINNIKSALNQRGDIVNNFYKGKKMSYEKWKNEGIAKYNFPVFVKKTGQTTDARVKNSKALSNRVGDALKIPYKLLGGKDDPNKYPVYEHDGFDDELPSNLTKKQNSNGNMNRNSNSNRIRNRNRKQKSDHTTAIVLGGTTVGLIGTALYFLLGI
jgi:hypothetical protein